MSKFCLRKLPAVFVMSLTLFGHVPRALSADSMTTPYENAKIDDFAAGRKAIDAKKGKTT